jgi:type I restriction enzyme M protein
MPDNVLFEENVGRRIRADLMAKCDLHTILRLPTGIFYAPGVKTNVLFFTRGDTDRGNTQAVWVYDMRAGAPAFGKRTKLTRGHFAEFEAAFGDDRNGGAPREDQGEVGRFRRFGREDIAARGDNLDIAWLTDESGGNGVVLEPEAIAAEIAANLRMALEEIEALSDLLEAGEEKSVPEAAE